MVCRPTFETVTPRIKVHGDTATSDGIAIHKATIQTWSKQTCNHTRFFENRKAVTRMLPPKIYPRFKNQIIWPHFILHLPHLGCKSIAAYMMHVTPKFALLLQLRFILKLKDSSTLGMQTYKMATSDVRFLTRCHADYRFCFMTPRSLVNSY